MWGVLTAAGTLTAPVFLLSPLSDVLSLAAILVRRARVVRRGTPSVPSVDLHPRRPHLLFLVPAHDEALLIDRCVRSLISLHRVHCDSSIVVLTDACTDDTAAIARRAGATVVDFGHTTPLGKAKLLDAAVQRGIYEPYDALVVIDADSEAAPDFADVIGRQPSLHAIVQQGHHGISNPRETWLTRLAALLNSARYDGQLSVRARAGLNTPLTGNGMCFGRDVLRQHGMRCTTVKEDLEIYATYTLAGVRILFCPAAVVFAQEARSLAQARTQRIRWEAGKWAIVRRYAWPIATSRLSFRQRLDTMAELTHHGPVLHGFAAAALALPILGQPGYAGVLSVVLLATTIPMVGWTILGFRKQPERLRLLGAIAALPAYLLWRAGILAVATFTHSGARWHRSPRHAPTTES